jgi:putative FmdB family regulatory protein
LPTYEYKCGNCGERLEEVRRMAEREELKPCHKCGEGYFQVQMSVTAPPKFNGSGFFVNDYPKSPKR